MIRRRTDCRLQPALQTCTLQRQTRKTEASIFKELGVLNLRLETRGSAQSLSHRHSAEGEKPLGNCSRALCAEDSLEMKTKELLRTAGPCNGENAAWPSRGRRAHLRVHARNCCASAFPTAAVGKLVLGLTLSHAGQRSLSKRAFQVAPCGSGFSYTSRRELGWPRRSRRAPSTMSCKACGGFSRRNSRLPSVPRQSSIRHHCRTDRNQVTRLVRWPLKKALRAHVWCDISAGPGGPDRGPRGRLAVLICPHKPVQLSKMRARNDIGH